MENEVKKSAGKAWLVPAIIAVVLLIGLVVFMVIMGKGTSAVADGTVTLAESVAPLEDGTAQLSDGVKQYTEGVDQVADGVEMLYENVPTLSDGVQQLADGAVALNKGVNVGDQSLSAGMKSLAAGVDGLDKMLAAGLTEEQAAGMAATVGSTVAQQAAATRDAQIAGSTATMQAGVAENKNLIVAAGLANDAMAPVKGIVRAGLLATLLQMTGAPDEATLQGAWVAQGATVIAGVNAQYGSSFATDLSYAEFMTQAVDYLVGMVIGGTVDGVNAQVVPVLAAGAVDGAINATVDTSKTVAIMVANQTMATVRQGMIDGKLFEGVKLLNAGVNGKDGLADGVKKLQAGTAQLNDGVPTLTDGIKQLFDGTQQLKENSQALRDGASSLKDAAPALIDGIAQLVDGAKKVNGFTPIH